MCSTAFRICVLTVFAVLCAVAPPAQVPTQGKSPSPTQAQDCGLSGPVPAADIQWLKSQQEAIAALDPIHVSDIRRLMDVLGLRKILQQSIPAQLAAARSAAMPLLRCVDRADDVANSVIAKMSAQLTGDELVDMYVLVYAKHFSRDEVEGVLAFYDSPRRQEISRRAAFRFCGPSGHRKAVFAKSRDTASCD